MAINARSCQLVKQTISNGSLESKIVPYCQQTDGHVVDQSTVLISETSVRHFCLLLHKLDGLNLLEGIYSSILS